MQSSIFAKRKNDAVLTVCQDNQEHRLLICAANQAAEKLLGYLGVEMMDQAFDLVLPEKIRDTLHSYIDFEEASQDLAGVVRKIPDFSLLNKEGQEIPVHVKVFYGVGPDPKHLHFELLLRDISLMKRIDQAKEDVYNTDLTIQNPSIRDTRKAVELISAISHDFAIEATIAMIGVDHFDTIVSNHGPAIANHITTQVVQTVGSSIRDIDIYGQIGDGRVLLGLFNCSSENAKIVLNRVRMKVESTPIREAGIDGFAGMITTISAGFMQVQTTMPCDVTLQTTFNALEHAKHTGGNEIYAASETT